MSRVVKTSGGGITTPDFKVNRFIGLSGIMLLTLLNKSVVKGCEFTIALTLMGIKLHNALALCGLPWLLLLHNRDLSEHVIPYGSFDESFNYHKQSLRNYKNII